MNIQLFNNKQKITRHFANAIAVPVNNNLETSLAHKNIIAYAEERRNNSDFYQIRKAHYPLKGGDTFVVVGKGYLKSDNLILCVLPIADSNAKIAKEKIILFYTNMFELALENRFKELSIPSISEGVYKYDINMVVEEGLRIASLYPELKNIRFFCYNDNYFKLFTEKLNQMLKNKT